jgi:hypothetical protein
MNKNNLISINSFYTDLSSHVQQTLLYWIDRDQVSLTGSSIRTPYIVMEILRTVIQNVFPSLPF